jgi:hypothetical protein
MNDMEKLENQLRSWAPRRPSAKLERRLFAGQIGLELDPREEPDVTGHLHGLRLGWLVPAVAAFLLLCMLLNQRQSKSPGDATNAGHLLAVISNNQSAYPPLTSAGQQNRPSANTFEWTNGSGSTSSIRSFLGLKARN